MRYFFHVRRILSAREHQSFREPFSISFSSSLYWYGRLTISDSDGCVRSLNVMQYGKRNGGRRGEEEENRWIFHALPVQLARPIHTGNVRTIRNGTYGCGYLGVWRGGKQKLFFSRSCSSWYLELFFFYCDCTVKGRLVGRRIRSCVWFYWSKKRIISIAIEKPVP